MRKLFLPAAVIASLGFASFVAPAAECCPFCAAASQTLTKSAEQATMILYGRLANARLDPNDATTGTTDLLIDSIVKSHDSVAGKKMLVLPRYVIPEKDTKYLVFCDFYQGKLDLLSGIPVRADSRIANFL